MNSKQENNDKVYVSDNKMLYRYPKDDYYADSVSLENGKICMQVGGHTICKSIKDWHKLGNDIKKPISSSDANGSKQESLDDILSTGKIIKNLKSSKNVLDIDVWTDVPTLNTNFGKDWGVTYEGKTISLQDFIQAYCNKQIEEAILAGWRQSAEGFNNEYWGGYTNAEDIEKSVIEHALKELKERE